MRFLYTHGKNSTRNPDDDDDVDGRKLDRLLRGGTCNTDRLEGGGRNNRVRAPLSKSKNTVLGRLLRHGDTITISCGPSPENRDVYTYTLGLGVA